MIKEVKMNDITPFLFNNIRVASPDDLSEAIHTVEHTDDAVALITRIANNSATGCVDNRHIKFACSCVSNLAYGDNTYISNAIIRLW
jgi:hypothetical protein